MAVKPFRIFLSHTDREEVDQKATTAIAVELRRVGIDVWLDREHPAPEATPQQQAAGPTPDNPLFAHLMEAVRAADAVVYVGSPASIEREYVRLEFDPRVLFQQFHASHPELTAEALPFYLVLVDPIVAPPAIWSSLITSTFQGRILNLTGAGSTPLILPMVLMTLIKEVAPEHLLPLDPSVEWVARHVIEDTAREAPGCPTGVKPTLWRQLENTFGLGPLFPGSLAALDDHQLRYGMFRLGDTARIAQMAPPVVKTYLSLWTANIILRSETLRPFEGHDFPVEPILPQVLQVLHDIEEQARAWAVGIQLGYALMSSPVMPQPQLAGRLLKECRDGFESLGATPLAALAEILRARAAGKRPSVEARQVIEDLGADPRDSDLRRLHHHVLDAAFPGPRVEATTEYRRATRSIVNRMHAAAKDVRGGFAKRGKEILPPGLKEFFDRVEAWPSTPNHGVRKSRSAKK